MTADTSTPLAARDHARAMAGTVAEAMPTLPAVDAEPPPGVDPSDVLWHETVAGGGYTAVVVPRGARFRLLDRDGDACAGILLHRYDRPTERLNVADTVKVQWQAYPGAGSLLLSDMGRVMAVVEHGGSPPIDAICGTSNHAHNQDRYGDGALDGPHPNGRGLFAVALAKFGLDRRDVAPNLNLFKGARVAADGSLGFEAGDGEGSEVVIRAELDLILSVVNVPHPLDDRPDYLVTPLGLTVWRGEPTAVDDPLRTATPEGERAYLNTESEVAIAAALTTPGGRR